MDSNEEMNGRLNDECFANNDAEFCSLYYKGIKRLLDIDIKTNVSYLFRYAKILNEYYDFFCHVKWDLKDQDEAIVKQLKASLYYRIIYVYRNATLLSSAVAFHFRNIYEQDPKIIKKLIKKKQVKICSIGGCSVSDIVAIITVLKAIALNSDIELDFRVTIIDFNAEWKNTCITILSCLEEFNNATWKINFIQCNLAKTNAWSTKTLVAIQEADIVTMVRYISKFNNKWNIVKMICDKLQTEALLFILDRPFKKLIEKYIDITDLGDFQLVHAELCDYHTLDIEAVKHLNALYKKHFGVEKHLRSNISVNLFVCVWLKVSPETYATHKKNLECIFQNNSEKYNPKQSFLCNNALTKWKNLFMKKKKAAGWNAKDIKKFVQMEVEKRNNMFGKMINLKKEMDSLQNQLLSKVRSLENDEKEFDEADEFDELDDYLIQKRQYSLMKKSAFFASLHANKLCYVNV